MPFSWKRILLILIDVLLLAACWVIAYNLRFAEGGIPKSPTVDGDNYVLQLQLLLLPVLVTHVVLFFVFHLYRGIWRYAGTTELRGIVFAGAIWAVGWSLFNGYLYQQVEFLDLPQRRIGVDAFEVIPIPWSILGLYLMMATIASGGVRLLPRLFIEASNKQDASDAPATLIVGASDVADNVLRNILRVGSDEFRPVCAVAQNPARVGLRLHGIPVVGTVDKIPDVIRTNAIKRVLIAVDNSKPSEIRRIITACETAEVSFRFVPSLRDLESGRVEISRVRPIEIEDLLGREPVQLELPADRNYVGGCVVMITGAGGSIGSELARQCAASGATKLLLVGKGENSIFEIAGELSRKHRGLAIEAIVADVRDVHRMDDVFRTHRPQIVFHAAAHKHVSLMESAPGEAVKNNILGTANVAFLAEDYGAERFVLISTDKAVSPTSVMGATKRYAERVVFSLAKNSRCCFQAVRFGNVLGSRGSVIPIFREQIRAGGPVTITHPDVTRYFMTIPEAVSLVLQAGSRNQNGSLYLLHMGEPVRIADLAKNMISLSGLRPDVDVKIEYIGLRQGEKLREELLTEAEGSTKTELEKIFVATPRDVVGLGQLEAELREAKTLAEEGDPAAIRAWLGEVISDYHAPDHAVPDDNEVRRRVRQSAERISPGRLFPEQPPAPAPAPEEKAPVPLPPVTPLPVQKIAVQEDFLDSPAAVIAPATESEAPVAEAPLEELPPAEEEPPIVELSLPVEEPFIGLPALEEPPVEEAPLVVAEPETTTLPAAEEEPAIVELTPRPEDVYTAPESVFAEEPFAEPVHLFDAHHPIAFDLGDDPVPEAEIVVDIPVPDAAAELIVSTINDAENAEILCSDALPLASTGEDVHAATLRTEGSHLLDVENQPALLVESEETPGDQSTLPATLAEEAWTEMAKEGFIIVLRATKATDAETLGKLVTLLNGTISAADKIVVLGEKDILSAVPASVATVVKDGVRAEGALVAEALAKHPDAAYLLTSSPEVIFEAGAFAAIAAALAKGAPLAYCDYKEDRDGQVTDVKLHEHEGCPHERFEFGPVIAYNLASIAAVGGVRKDLNFAWEYDLHLKLMEKAPFARVAKASYTRFVPVTTDEKGKKVFSPGMGPLGGFSYVFYPADVEKEVTSVFEEALKRRGAWIDHAPVTVNHGNREFPVLGSIVIPILNRVKYIANAIEKVQKGTFQNFEVIIVDNGSTDGTIELIQKLAAADARIKLIHGKGGSIASALNEGIKAARGKYICQLDSDDEYAPNCLELMLGHLEAHPQCGLAISYYRLMDENAVIIDDVAPITHSGYSRNQILRRDGAGAVRIFPKAVLEEFGYYDEEHYGNFGEDYDMVLKTGEKYSVDRVHHVLYHYRRHADNTDVTRDPAMKYKNKNRARQEALRRRLAVNKQLGKA